MIKTTSRIGAIVGIPFLLLMGISVFLSACASGDKVPDTKPGISGTEKLLVLPFRSLNQQTGQTGLIRCSVCGTAFASGQVPPSSSQLLTEHLLSFFNENRRFKVISSRPAITVRPNSFSANKHRFAEQQALISAGRAARAATTAKTSHIVSRRKWRVSNSMLQSCSGVT